MTVKPILLTTLLGLAATAAWAQTPALQPPGGAPAAPATDGPANALMANGFAPLNVPSARSWIDEGEVLPVGGDGPLGREWYLMFGPTLANGNGVFGQHLNGGFMIEGGGRVLLFNPARDAAWTIKAGLTLQTHRASGANPPIDFFDLEVQIRELHRFSGVVAIGRDWFLYGASPLGDGRGAVRAGMDLGLRWGTHKVTLNVLDDPFEFTDYRFRTENYGGVVLGWHAMVEVPMGGWIGVGGFRIEYGYNWSNILPGNLSNIHDVNLLFTTGVRY